VFGMKLNLMALSLPSPLKKGRVGRGFAAIEKVLNINLYIKIIL